MNFKKIFLITITVFMIKAGFGQGNSLDLHLVKLHSGKMSKIPGFTGYFGKPIGSEGKAAYRLSAAIGFGGKSDLSGLQCYDYNTGQTSTFSVTYRYLFYIVSAELQYYLTGNDEDGGLYGRAGLGYRTFSTSIRYNDYPSGYTDTLYLGGSESSVGFSSTSNTISGICFNGTLGYEIPALDFGNLFFELSSSFPVKEEDFENIKPKVISLRFGVKWLIGQ